MMSGNIKLMLQSIVRMQLLHAAIILKIVTIGFRDINSNEARACYLFIIVSVLFKVK